MVFYQQFQFGGSKEQFYAEINGDRSDFFVKLKNWSLTDCSNQEHWLKRRKILPNSILNDFKRLESFFWLISASRFFFLENRRKFTKKGKIATIFHRSTILISERYFFLCVDLNSFEEKEKQFNFRTLFVEEIFISSSNFDFVTFRQRK